MLEQQQSVSSCFRHLLAYLFSDWFFFTFFNSWKEKKRQHSSTVSFFFPLFSSGYYERENTDLNESRLYLIPHDSYCLFPTTRAEILLKKNKNGRNITNITPLYLRKNLKRNTKGSHCTFCMWNDFPWSTEVNTWCNLANGVPPCDGVVGASGANMTVED